MDTLITVIPVHNGEKYIGATLESIAAQTHRPDRLIVLDNCSTDGTRGAVTKFCGMCCEWIQNDRNLGLFGNLNRALEFAPESTFLHLLHADDLILPDFYQRAIDALRSSPGRALAYCLPKFINENDEPAHGPRVKPPSRLRVISPERFIAQRAELRPIYFVGVLLKTDQQPSPCKFREDMPQVADHVFWAEWMKHSSQAVELPVRLAKYRFHSSSGTSRNLSQLQPWVLDEWRAMQAVTGLLQGSRVCRWVRLQKLKAIFAARCFDKVAQVEASAPEFAREIRNAALQIAGSVPFVAGKAAVLLRDFVFFSRANNGSS
jgi:glycosyltransferase involved in cell wall biosynthesis